MADAVPIEDRDALKSITCDSMLSRSFLSLRTVGARPALSRHVAYSRDSGRPDVLLGDSCGARGLSSRLGGGILNRRSSSGTTTLRLLYKATLISRQNTLRNEANFEQATIPP
jgi:hypothetical protein